MLLLGLAVVALQIAAYWLSGPARLDANLVGAVLWIALIIAVVWLVTRSDELIRRVWSQAAAFAFAVGVLAVSVFDALHVAGLFHATLADAEVVFYLPWAGAMIFFLRRYPAPPPEA